MVACDGHSYERSAILDVIATGNGLSPLTREQLDGHLFPNRNLKKRIELYEEEVLDAATTAYKRGSSGASASAEAPPAKSSCPRGGAES